MASIGDRIKTVRVEKGWSQAALARRSGVSQRTVSNLETNRNRTSRDLIAIARALRVNPLWLESGAGLRIEGASGASALAPAPRELDPLRVRVIGACAFKDAWGSAFAAIERSAGFVSYFSADSRVYAIRCTGDGLAPRLQHNELVVLEPSVVAQPGDEVLLKGNAGVMLGRLKYRREGRLHLESLNAGAAPGAILEEGELEAVHYLAGIAKPPLWRPD
jgi:transcriptional regulator with XRE-family HTH domain